MIKKTKNNHAAGPARIGGPERDAAVLDRGKKFPTSTQHLHMNPTALGVAAYS